MKTKVLCVTAFLVITIVASLTLSANAQNLAPLTLNVNLGSDPLTLDPALSGDTISSAVIEQLFIGLVDLDDNTYEPRPELATSWTVSSDKTVYTFTLRDDVYWTDGHRVTANDVRYGILRTLNPALGSVYAYPLYVIKNAEAYNTGIITDPNLVGVTVLDDTHLRITLEYPASYVLSILSLSVARPMPQWTIETWGDAWTDPAHIVTNGPYRLTEWVLGDHILLDKNPTYFDANNVQIERVKIWFLPNDVAWTMYLNGQLDTTDLPMGISLDPVLKQEVRSQPVGCTYYYGFNVSQPPFDNPLVRKAFIAATDREGLVNLLGGGQRPALTFTPPGVFGHVDGYTEGVGIPYNPIQARQWLAQAGYPNGQGLPPITLWFNETSAHRLIAEYLRDSWYNALGVNVALQTLPWVDYLKQLREGKFQIWRLGWCMDYPDANNFLKEGVHRSALGNWYNAFYESLLSQAAREQNPDIRRMLYRQAEEILVETDAVMLPLYYYTSTVAVKPYLERTFVPGFPDFATWRITKVSKVIGPNGGSLTSYYGDTTIQFPPGAFDNNVIFTHAPAYGMPPGGNLTRVGQVFNLMAVYSDSDEPAQLAPNKTYTLTVQYRESERGPAIENTLALYYWDGSQWAKEPTSEVDPVNNIVVAHPNHFSLWAVLGETKPVYLPLVSKGY